MKSGGDGPKLLVIRDSYSDCLAPFLSQRFSEVHLFDLRYNRTSLRSYLEDHQIDMVLILYSFSVFLANIAKKLNIDEKIVVNLCVVLFYYGGRDF